MMADWRGQFGNPAMPFLIVQIPNYGAVLSPPPDSQAGQR